MTSLLLLLSIPISILAVLVSYTLIQGLRFKFPPGPPPKPVLGNLYDIQPVRFRCFADWARSYGPIISVWFGPTLNAVVSSAALAREVLKENDQQLANRHRNRAAARFSRDGADLIWADYGPHYVKVRKLCTLELFTPKRLEAMRHIREEEVMAMVESIFKASSEQFGKALPVREFLGAVAFNNITRLVFGKRFMDADGVMDEQGKEFKAIVTSGIKIGAMLPIVENIPWLRFFYPLDEEAIARHGARRDRLSKIIMEEHTQARKTGGAKDHFVDALLTLQDKYDLSEDTIIGLLWDMITAGMDTTAISVEWALAELIRNPSVQEKAQEELDRVVGPDRVMTEADIPSLPYLQCVAKEALRLHPPTPLMLPHMANANVKLGGYDVPKGSIVHVNVWAIARDPEAWKDPLAFKPDRFFEEDVDMKGHDFRLLPFGAGRRVCPGAQLGINLVTSMLGHLLHHFRWVPPGTKTAEDIDLTESPGMVTYMKNPLEGVATPRLNAHLNKREALKL